MHISFQIIQNVLTKIIISNKIVKIASNWKYKQTLHFHLTLMYIDIFYINSKILLLNNKDVINVLY